MRSAFTYLKRMLSEIQMHYRFSLGGRPTPTDADLLRDVLAAGFWSSDGVCHYCGKFCPRYRTHGTYCLAKSLIAWAVANGAEFEDRDNIFPTMTENAAERARTEAANAALLGSLSPPMTNQDAAQVSIGLMDAMRQHLRGDPPTS